jgi:DASH complex subunit DAD3
MSAFAASDDPDAQDYSFAEDDPATTTPPIPQDQNLSSGEEGSHGRSQSNNPLLGNENPLVSELEQEVLDEYSRLLRNVNQVGKPGSFSFSFSFSFLAGVFFSRPEIKVQVL